MGLYVVLSVYNIAQMHMGLCVGLSLQSFSKSIAGCSKEVLK